MSKIESKHFKKGYGILPYFIIRITAGTYLQLPIHFNCNLNPREGVSIQINPKCSIDQMKDKCISTLKEILFGELAISDQCHPHLPLLCNKSFVGCFVFEPDCAYYVNKDGDINEGLPPNGGVVISMNNEMVFFPNNKHYLLL